MGEISWGKGMYIDVAEIDQQHERLVGMANKLYHAYMAGEERKVLAGIIQGMSDYAREHFATEERYMTAHNYPDMEAHLEAHRSFAESSTRFLIEYLAGKQEMSAEILDFLTDWWLRHITVTDKAMGAFLKDQGAE